MAYFSYVTPWGDITFPTFFALLQMASSSRFVDLSEDDIIKFCDEQENENTTKKTIYDIAIFKKFLAIYNSSEDREIQGIPAKELQPIIKNSFSLYESKMVKNTSRRLSEQLSKVLTAI